jgi:tetratricopeptide (TPR) repeat protein
MADIHITQPDPHHEEHEQRDFEALVEHIKRNPLLYVAGLLFVALAAIAGFMVQASNVAQEREAAGNFLEAVRTEDPALRVAELQAVADSGSEFTDEALYLAAESAYSAENFAEAKTLFERLRNEFPQSRYLPDAVEGLGYLAEDNKDYAQALAYYQEILEKWPLTFAGRRQELNIGRVRERLTEYQAAADAYASQVQSFPDSTIAARAQQALDALLAAHPEVTVAGVTEAETPVVPEASAEESLPTEAPQDAAVDQTTAPEEAAEVIVEDLAPSVEPEEAPQAETTPTE